MQFLILFSDFRNKNVTPACIGSMVTPPYNANNIKETYPVSLHRTIYASSDTTNSTCLEVAMGLEWSIKEPGSGTNILPRYFHLESVWTDTPRGEPILASLPFLRHTISFNICSVIFYTDICVLGIVYVREIVKCIKKKVPPRTDVCNSSDVRSSLYPSPRLRDGSSSPVPGTIVWAVPI